MGQILCAVEEDDGEMSALELEMQHLIRMISMMALGVAVVLFVLSLFK